jgi:2-isopropylmalate synthase
LAGFWGVSGNDVIMKIFTLDTTLRDGTQGESVNYSVEDKLLIVQKLDELGIDYVEGGYPGSNPKDKEFFRRAQNLRLQHTKLTAFGSTRFHKNAVHYDRNVAALLDAGAPVVSVFGKSWNLHVERALGIGEGENLELIEDTVRFLKLHGKEVIYDAEHFFDGFFADPAFALRTLEAAQRAGADVLCLCDTNGGTLPSRLVEAVSAVHRRFGGVLGIHTHNDSGTAVANSLAAVGEGVTHVQGCMNGYGERCGNANLASVIANLELKLGHTAIGRERLSDLTSVCKFVAELANLPLRDDQPFVGNSAFAHKGGMHVHAVLRDSATYEHVAPDTVGNCQRVLVSELSGRANVEYKLNQYDPAGRLGERERRGLLERVKQMEYDGYQLEAAEATFELLVLQAFDPAHRFFEVESYEVSTRVVSHRPSWTTATVAVRAQDGVHSASATGEGPLNALHLCLRSCLSKLYPQITDVQLTDYKVRVLDSHKGTASKVRVLIEWSDQTKTWTTVGVSNSVIEASWEALVDAVRLDLARLSGPSLLLGEPVDDYRWGV